jgi:hypothetical protein
MRVTIRDREVLNSLRPVDLIAYLRASGWIREAEIGNKAAVWVKPNGPEPQDVIVPLQRDAADFALRIAEVLGRLEFVEQRSQEDIIKDVITASADLIRIRSLSAGAADGTIPLDIGVAFVEHAREMILAAACAAVAPNPYWPRRKPQRAAEYIEHVRMGQTEQGSYVLTIHSPVPPALRADAPTESPFERQVVETLTRSLRSVREAAQQAIETADLQPFRAAVHNGVSANLCDALVGLGRVSPNNGIEVAVSWSRSRPIEGAPRSSTAIPSDLIPVIQEASRLFKETEPQDDFELLGFVERLDRPLGANVGQVFINALIDERPRRVRMELEDRDYQVALQAHKESRPISCVGDLRKEGRSFHLLNPRQFQLLEIEEAE